ncbi:hypothetical protein [Flavobacterium agrisoli]|uniref:DUF3300 domain-containing protein n=1 Tax=Flavobacterium agrisoli TaxID=2793066 RepID=A0A934PKD3_9FLAO|nr:hypothetical protein [Flavobacterium agrisoli]MBK0368949.1 hypothetical protein [Flavobacterium agrisoli]
MKTKLLILSLVFAITTSIYAQAGATVYAKNSDISDNLDLRAVASIFGESRNLEDFERRLNEPKYQISNLDLNNDNRVDYLRVIESVEDRMHLVIIQSILDRDVYQDVATIEVERNNYNNVNIQIVGNDYLYGPNFIYEPVFVSNPIIYTSFWVTNYRPYYSTWGWNYYPNYYISWRPYPIYRYRNNVNVCINVHNTYNYVNVRRSNRAVVLYDSRRSNGYERLHPNNSFVNRNANVNNRYELEQRRVSYQSERRNSNFSSNTTTINSRNTTARTSSSNSENSSVSSSPNSVNNRVITNTNNRNYYTNRQSSSASITNNNTSRNTNSRMSNSSQNTISRNNSSRSYSTSNDNLSRRNSSSVANTNRSSAAPATRSESPRTATNNSRSGSNMSQNRERSSSNNSNFSNRRG